MTDISFTQQLDRLVDGELRPEEYRQLLKQCEAEPERWRACALAFVEHQAWREALGELGTADAERERIKSPDFSKSQAFESANESDFENDRQADSKPSADASWRTFTSQQWVSLAASLILVFAFGMLAQRARTPQPPSAEFLAGHQSSANVGDAASPRLAEKRKLEREDAGGEEDVQGENSPLFAENARPAAKPLGSVTFVVSGNGQPPQRIETPVYEHNDYHAQWLVSEQRYKKLAQEARRDGRRLRYRRDLLPVALENGGRLIFPIEQIEVSPVDLRNYQ